MYLTIFDDEWPSGVCLIRKEAELPESAFSLNGHAGMSVQYWVADLL